MPLADDATAPRAKISLVLAAGALPVDTPLKDLIDAVQTMAKGDDTEGALCWPTNGMNGLGQGRNSKPKRVDLHPVMMAARDGEPVVLPA